MLIDVSASLKVISGIRISTVVLSVFVFYLIGTHLRLSIYSGESILLPMYPMLISSAIFALLFIKPLIHFTGYSLIIIGFFILTQPYLTFSPESISIGNFFGSLQLFVSVISAISVLYALSVVDKVRLRKLLLIMWSFFIILAIAETLGLKPIFDVVRDVLYSETGRFVYFAEHRDLEIYGRVRTTVFASEPSFLADTLSALVLMIFFLDHDRGKKGSWFKLIIMLAISFSLSPSFKMFFYLIALFVWQFWPDDKRRLIILLGSLFLSSIFLLIFIVPISGFIYQYAGNHLETGSFFGRILVGPAIGWNVFTSYPIYGYGIGNDEGLYPLIYQAWYDSGAFTLFPWYRDLPATDLMTNGFWWQWTFLGLVGGLLFTKLILRLLSQVGVQKPLRTLVCIWIVWYAGFAFVDPLSWYMVVVFSIGEVTSTKRLASPEQIKGC